MHYLIVHGHFYQPPREDPITGEIVSEPSAYPFSNWNERIHAECYRPNADLGNFRHMSFNIGPTLLSWMEQHDDETVSRIIQQDKDNVREHGVGNAMAQVYNHAIMPLISREDKMVQVRWGIADFRHRFGRDPKGMWLAETAADNETLEILVDNNIDYVILAPWQAAQDIDVRQPHTIPLSNGNITAFFYHKGLGGSVSFEDHMTVDADRFAQELVPLYTPEHEQVLTIATDGELYGHHKPFREKFLSYLLNHSLSSVGISPTYPALWLRDHEAQDSTSIVQNSSWSCLHGVDRWSAGCACTPGDSSWKEDLFKEVHTVAQKVKRSYEVAVRPYADPDALLDDYIHVVLKETTLEDVVGSHTGISKDEFIKKMGQLLGSQYHRQLMFTSCGWYFESADRLEPAYTRNQMRQALRLASQTYSPQEANVALQPAYR